MRILVAGGAGFIGSHLCKRLLGQGHEVICLDNFCTGQYKNIQHQIHHHNFTLIQQDVCEKISFHVDQIYNLACPASPVYYQKDPIKTFETSVLGTRNLLQLAEKTGARFLQASTSEVYGDPLEHPQKESYNGNVNITGPRACYDEGKRAAETLIMDYYRTKKLGVCIVRIFNTYGPKMRMDDGRVISNFIVQALEGEPLTVYGDGSQTRSFCYVDDLVSGLILSMEKEDLVGPVNLGNPHEHSVLKMAEYIKEITKSKSKIVFKKLPKDDPKLRRPSIFVAKRKLGWELKIGLSEGLKKTIHYFGLLIDKKNNKS